MHSARLSKHLYLCLLLLCIAASTPKPAALAQDASGTGVEQLRQRLMSGSAAAVVHVSNLHGTTRALVRPVDNVVVEGVVQSRPIAGLFRGADEIVPAGEVVRILGVEAVTGKKNDLLRVTIATPGNAVAPVAFPLPPNAAQTMTAAQLEALVLPVLTPANTVAGTPATRSASRVHEAPAAAPPGWVVRRTPAGAEALLRGTAENAGRTAPAVLVLGCPTVALSPERTALTSYVELRVPKSSVPFDVLFVGEKDGDDNGYVHVQVNTSAEIKADLASWTLIPETGNVAPLGLDLNSKELEQLTNASAVPLRVAVLPTDKPETGVTAHFALPPDPSPAQTVMAPCVDKAKAAQAALHASRAIECPEIPDLVLLNADVRRAATGKPLPVDPDRDQGVGWTLPKATRSHPAVEKTVLVCSYGPPDQKPDMRKSTKTETLPIPPGASLCESWITTTESRSNAYCERSAK